MRKRVFVMLLAAATAWGGCSDSTGPQTVGPTQLHIVRQDTAAPALQTYQASVWAVRGIGRTLQINYATNEEFFRLDIGSDALWKRPDGSLVAQGDSVLITVTVDPQLLLFQFEPTGLQFDPAHPAQLKIDYAESDHDLNEDGVVNQQDTTIATSQLGVWRQESSGTSWSRIGATQSASIEEFEADLLHFSNYALGW